LKPHGATTVAVMALSDRIPLCIIFKGNVIPNNCKELSADLRQSFTQGNIQSLFRISTATFESVIAPSKLAFLRVRETSQYGITLLLPRWRSLSLRWSYGRVGFSKRHSTESTSSTLASTTLHQECHIT